MKHLSRNDIESIAARVITQYSHLSEISDSQIYKVNPLLLADKVFGLTVDFHRLSSDGSILGVTAYQEIGVGIWDDENAPGYYYLDGKTILIDTSLTDDDTKIGRCNFTIAHEIAHQILKILFPNDYGIKKRIEPIRYYRENSEMRTHITDWEEWQANALASSVLIPADMLKNCMFLFGLPEKIPMLNKIFSASNYERFCNLASFLGVSKKALAIRMKQLNLLDKDYLDNPNAVIEVEYKEDVQ